MGRKWIVPFAVFLILLVAWPLRWDREATMTSTGVAQQVIYYRDRWTGQTWATLYGHFGEQYYTGQMIPLPPQPAPVQSVVLFQPQNDAWILRNLLASAWAIVLAASFGTSAFLFLREGKPVSPQQEEATR